MSRSTLGAAAAVAIAAVLLVAGVSKLAAHAGWRLQADGLGVPWGVARLVPFVEVVLGALLLVQLQRNVLAWFAVALLVAFSALLIVRLAQGRRPPCACFGSISSKPIGAGHLVRNAVFTAIAVAAAVL